MIVWIYYNTTCPVCKGPLEEVPSGAILCHKVGSEHLRLEPGEWAYRSGEPE